MMTAERHALVVGGSLGIGFAVAKRLVADGASVTIAARDGTRLEAAARRLGAEERGVGFHTCDVTSSESVKRLRTWMDEQGRMPTVLITNTGTPAGDVTPESLEAEPWVAAFNQTVAGVIRLTNAFVPHMASIGCGRVVHIASITARQPGDYVVAGATRPAVLGFAKVTADLYGPHGVCINSVLPGYTRTETYLEDLRSRATPQRSAATLEQELINTIPAQRVAEPDEVAALVAWLCSADASYVTGTAIAADGGFLRAI